MKKRLAILACLFAVSFPVVPIWGQESSELNLTAGATKQIDDILLNDISDFKFGWTRTSSNVRSQPDINSEIVMTLSFNEKIIVKDYNDKWNYVISVCSLSNLFFRFHTTTLTEACSNELKQHHL